MKPSRPATASRHGPPRPRPSASFVAVLALGLAVLALGATGLAVTSCTADADKPASGQRVTQLPDPGDAIDERLMLSLSLAKNFHHIAKVYMTDGNLDEATAAVQQILSIDFPPGAPEGEDVRLDAHAMLAKLLVARGKLEDAMTVVDRGIASASRDSFFLANLHTVKGEVYEAQAAVALDDGAPDAEARARELRHAAITAYTRSNEINEALQKRLVEEPR